MLTFLFWNLNKKPLERTAANLATRYDVDVLVLTETKIPPDLLLVCLNKDSVSGYDYAPGLCDEIAIFVKFPSGFAQPVYESERTTIRHLNLPGRTDILLAATHFPSKLHWTGSSQAQECVPLSDAVKTAEEQIGHRRTVLVGDLNMNPFEDGLVGAPALHAVMSREIARKGSRVVQGREYPFFYNPMWGLLGDATPGPPGTYYYPNAEHVSLFWYMFDQVLVRPELLGLFDNDHLDIPQSDGVSSLVLPSGIPDAKRFSDHLPICFRIDV